MLQPPDMGAVAGQAFGQRLLRNPSTSPQALEKWAKVTPGNLIRWNHDGRWNSIARGILYVACSLLSPLAWRGGANKNILKCSVTQRCVTLLTSGWHSVYPLCQESVPSSFSLRRGENLMRQVRTSDWYAVVPTKHGLLLIAPRYVGKASCTREM